MILNSIDKQLTLSEDGQISWQKDLTNPMPGEAVATVIKGDSVLAPSCKIIDAPSIADQDKDAVLKFIQEWLTRHVQTILEPLFRLKEEDIAEGPAREIADKVFEAIGIIPREDVQSLIDQMSEEQRATLRPKKLRFSPLLVYLPELNKPVGVKLQALLLSLWEDKDLPAQVPADGIVSFSVTDKDIDPNYYRAIGYPVYGPRSIRVDMLDRVVCAVYEKSKDGKFQAQHQMAEWLGSNIADLYAVLEAMGHTKDYDPADEVKEEEPEAETAKAEDAKLGPEREAKDDSESKPVVIDMEKKEQVKPELATFRLKKGKAIKQAQSESYAPSNKSQKFSDKKQFSSDKKKFKSKNKKHGDKKSTGQRVYKAEAEEKPEDNPFAILEQLKVGNKKDS